MIKKIFSHCLNDFKNAKLNTAERLVLKKTRTNEIILQIILLEN